MVDPHGSMSSLDVVRKKGRREGWKKREGGREGEKEERNMKIQDQ